MAVEEHVLGREALLRRAGELLPALKSRAAETEKLRQMPAKNIEELTASGLLRVANPERYGGYADVGVDLCLVVAMELGRSCGSTAGCYSVWSSHNWMIGHWPLEAQEEYFAG